jgi:hypothetical protein
MVTVWLVDTEAAWALNTAVVEPAPTVTEAGSVNNAGLLAANATRAPPIGAAADSVTLQLVLAPEATFVGEHPTFETASAGATRLIVALPVLPL